MANDSMIQEQKCVGEIEEVLFVVKEEPVKTCIPDFLDKGSLIKGEVGCNSVSNVLAESVGVKFCAAIGTYVTQHLGSVTHLNIFKKELVDVSLASDGDESKAQMALQFSSSVTNEQLCEEFPEKEVELPLWSYSPQNIFIKCEDYYQKCHDLSDTITPQNLKEQKPSKHMEKTPIISKPHKCDYCSSSFARKSVLQLHILTHTGERSFSCDICPYKCSRKGTLKNHMITHTRVKPYCCDICNYECSRKDQLKNHIMFHIGEKPHKCDLCDYSCFRKNQLLEHISTHTGDKPYNCEICGFKFFRKCDLKCHNLIHTGEKPFSCAHCDYRCTKKVYLKGHMLTHTGEKPFRCELCEYKCTRNIYLKRHLATHTGQVQTCQPFAVGVLPR